MANTIYSVKGAKIGKLNNLELKVYEFITAKEFLDVVKVGDSLSEKKLKLQFANFNKEKLTVNINSLINEKNLRKVCLFFANQVKANNLPSSVIPVVTVNKTHGNFAIDFKSVDTLESEYTEKELTEKAKNPKKTVFEFLTNYLNKEDNQLEISMADGKNDKINELIAILESLKD